MAHVWLIWYTCTLLYIFFKIAISFIELVNLGETCHLKGHDFVIVWLTMLLLYCYHCDCMQQHYDVMQFEYLFWHHTTHEWVMNIDYQTWISQGRFTSIIHTPSKQWGVCDNVSILTEKQILMKFSRLVRNDTRNNCSDWFIKKPVLDLGQLLLAI